MCTRLPAVMNPKIFLPLVVSISVVGCSGSADTERPALAPPITSAAPKKVPTTMDEKIEAIQNAAIPEDQKKAAIEKVRSGGL